MFVLRKFICRQSLSSFLNHRRKKPRGLQRRFFSIVVLKNANKTTKYVALHLHRMMCDCINNKERDLFLLSGLLYSSFQHSTSYKMSRAYRHVFMSWLIGRWFITMWKNENTIRSLHITKMMSSFNALCVHRISHVRTIHKRTHQQASALLEQSLANRNFTNYKLSETPQDSRMDRWQQRRMIRAQMSSSWNNSTVLCWRKHLITPALCYQVRSLAFMGMNIRGISDNQWLSANWMRMF